MVLKEIVYYIRLYKMKNEWRKNNSHNETEARSIFPVDKVKVGNHTYGPLNIKWLNNNAKVHIGHYCSIGPDVEFLVGGEHNYKRISTWPFQSKIYRETTKDIVNRDIIIEDDVWIGMGSLIMSGALIGRGSVVGARSIVTKSIPPYSIYVGNKVIKKRFSEEIIEKLKLIDYSKIEHNKLDNYKMFCQTEITEENIDEVLSVFL